MFNSFLHKYSIFHKSSLRGSMVPADTLNLHVSFILLFFVCFRFVLPLARAHAKCMIHYLLEKSTFFFHWVQNYCTLIVIYCITSNAEHVVTLRASVEYHWLESTKNILMFFRTFYSTLKHF